MSLFSEQEANQIRAAFEILGRVVTETNLKNGWTGSRELAAELDKAMGHYEPTTPYRRDLEKKVVQHQIVELALVAGEAHEAIEELRDGHAVTETYYNGTKPEGVPSEAADVIIRTVDFSAGWSIALADAVMEKMDYNDTRGYRHGGKKA